MTNRNTFYQITLESEHLDKLKELIVNLSDDIEPVYPFITHDENGMEFDKENEGTTTRSVDGEIETCNICGRYICDDPDCESECCQPSLNRGKCKENGE
tara:strand:+ start:3958 stop:4254 length:297 start_codon:yes stop_codon:yes gene_type:complete